MKDSAEEEEKALLHFELWQVYKQELTRQKKASKVQKTLEASDNAAPNTDNSLSRIAKNHRQKALQLFKNLNAIKPKKEFEQKIDLLMM